MEKEKIIPKQKQIDSIRKAGKNIKDSIKEEKELGSKSLIEIVIITPAANPKEETSKSSERFLKKIGIVPIIVDKPASIVKRKEVIYITTKVYDFLYLSYSII